VPTLDKTMRLHAQNAMTENGYIHIPESAPWLSEYLHELTVFPKGKHDDCQRRREIASVGRSKNTSRAALRSEQKAHDE